jgi:hypothetical protein
LRRMFCFDVAVVLVLLATTLIVRSFLGVWAFVEKK